ncbi:MAG: hypothetical protein Q9212_005996 [Teloschistes hypoglaucus]
MHGCPRFSATPGPSAPTIGPFQHPLAPTEEQHSIPITCSMLKTDRSTVPAELQVQPASITTRRLMLPISPCVQQSVRATFSIHSSVFACDYMLRIGPVTELCNLSLSRTTPGAKKVGYGCGLTFGLPRIFARRFYLAIYCVQVSITDSCRISVHWLLDFPRIVPQDSKVFRLARSGDVEGIRALFDAGAATAKDVTVYGVTLLHTASRRRDLCLMRLLIEQGADVNAAEEAGESPLHAALSFADNYEAVRLLMANGADLANRATDNQTALHTIFNSTVAHVLMTCDWIEATVADKDDKSIGHFIAWSSRSTVVDFQRARAHDLGDLWTADRSGRNCLHFAASRGNFGLLEYLLKSAAPSDVLETDSQGLTPLHHAVQSTRASAVIKLLLARGGNLLTKDHSDRNILHHAAQWNTLEAVQEMLRLGVDNTLLGRDQYERLHVEYMSGDPSSAVGESLSLTDPAGPKISKLISDVSNSVR